MSFNHREEHEDRDMWKIEVNLDDMQAEQMGYVMDLLFDYGANDVYYTPLIMKKNRPSYMLTILVSQEKKEKMAEILFRETTTLGIRYYPVSVYRLERKFVPINTKWGKVNVKIGMFQGEIVQYAPEYDECVLVANQNEVPLKKVYEYIKKEAINQLPELSNYFQS